MVGDSSALPEQSFQPQQRTLPLSESGQSSSAHWHQVFQSVPDRYLLLSPQLFIVEATDAYLNITMTKRDDVIGRSVFDVFPDNPDDKHATGVFNLRASLNRVLQRGKADELEFQRYDIRRPASRGAGFEERWWRVINQPIFDGRGSVQYIVHRVDDVTDFLRISREKNTLDQHIVELELLNNKLHHSEQTLRLFIGAVKDYAMIALDPQGIIVSWNAGAERLKGYKQEEIVGKHFSVLYDQPDLEAHKPELALQKASEHGSFRIEGWRKRKDGSLFWADVLLSVIRDPKGELLGFAKVTRDMTERKRVQDQIKELMEQRENFVAALTHDLKTPILAANRALDLLLEEDFGKVSESQAEILQTIRNSNDAMYGLVALLLDVYRYDNGSKRLQIEPHELGKLVDTVVKRLEPIAMSKSIEVQTKFPESLSPVACDSLEISRVIQNLLGNALKFTPAGGLVTIDVQQTPESTTISVRDTGPGIENDLQPSLFRRFYQPPPSARIQAGSGLGLYLSRCIVEAHGGSIGFETQAGNGSTFFFTLPNAQNGTVPQSRPNL